jgi:ribosome maturation factor RimP
MGGMAVGTAKGGTDVASDLTGQNPVVDRVLVLVQPIVDDLGLVLYDLEYAGGTLRVVLEGRDGAVSLDDIALATRLVSRELDESDPVPGRYTLEVTSPGLERALRLPRHYLAAVGATVSVKVREAVDGSRRFTGVLASVGDGGIVVRTESGDREFAYSSIERARKVFEWGPGAAR